MTARSADGHRRKHPNRPDEWIDRRSKDPPSATIPHASFPRSRLNEDESLDTRSLTRPLSSGCVVVMAAAIVSCLLLFLNGGVVMALVNVLDDWGFSYMSDDRITQFIVLIGPVLLLVIQWLMIDYVTTRLRRPR